MLLVHMFVFLDRFKNDDSNINYDPYMLALQEYMVDDLDRTLREIGVGDARVSKRIRDMGEAFFGRMQAYDAALAEGKEAVHAALERNLFATVPEEAREEDNVHRVQIYLRELQEALATQFAGTLANGVIQFPNPATAVAEAVAETKQ